MAFYDPNRRNFRRCGAEEVFQPVPTRIIPPAPRYKECMKNHTIINQIGQQYHTIDGCCEFLPAGPDGSAESLKCDGCGCHRSYHRREDFNLFYPPRTALHVSCIPPLRAPALALAATGHVSPTQPQPPLLALPPPQSDSDDRANPNGGATLAAGSTSGVKKRFRTKFTQDQKSKMYTLAEKIGWTMHRSNNELVQQFCNEAGVKREVFKVWLHNHKIRNNKNNGNGSNNSN